MAAGCAQGVPQYNVYVLAFNAQYEQGDSVLDIVGQAERAVGGRQLNPAVFDPDNAAYYLDTVDPPITASFRASLKSLKTYNEALVGLTNGEAANVLAARVSMLATNTAAGISGEAGLVALPRGGGRGVVLATTALRSGSLFRPRRGGSAKLPAELIKPSRDAQRCRARRDSDDVPIMRRSLVVRGLTRPPPASPRPIACWPTSGAPAGWVLLLDKACWRSSGLAAAKSSDAPRTSPASPMRRSSSRCLPNNKAIRLKQ